MTRHSIKRTTAGLLAAALPLVAAATLFAGTASAESTGGVPLEPVATNPGAQFPDPALNGAAAGAITGSAGGAALGSVVGSIPGALGGSALGALIGGGIGALVGILAPDAIPQVLP